MLCYKLSSCIQLYSVEFLLHLALFGWLVRGLETAVAVMSQKIDFIRAITPKTSTSMRETLLFQRYINPLPVTKNVFSRTCLSAPNFLQQNNNHIKNELFSLRRKFAYDVLFPWQQGWLKTRLKYWFLFIWKKIKSLDCFHILHTKNWH